MRRAAGIFDRVVPRGSYFRHVALLAGGTAGAQLLLVAASPLLTRLYTPESFGLLAVFASLLTIGSAIISLRYNMAIPLPESDKEAGAVLVLSCLLCVSLAAVFGFVLLFFRHELAGLLGAPDLADYMWLVPLGLVTSGTYQAASFWSMRKEEFGKLARTRVFQSGLMLLVQLAGFGFGAVSLLAGRIVGQSAGAFTLLRSALSNGKPAFEGMSLRNLRNAAARYRRFPLFSIWGGAFSNAGRELPPLMFSALFGVSTAGLYMLANRVLAMPLALLGRAMGDALFSAASKAVRSNQIADLVMGVHRKLVRISLPATVLVFFLAPISFGWVFGASWSEAGRVAGWLTFMLYGQFIVTPLMRVMLALEQQVFESLLQALLFVARLLALLVGFRYSDFIGTVLLFSVISALCYFIYLGAVVRLSGSRVVDAILPTLQQIPRALAISAPIITGKVLGLGKPALLVCVGLSLLLFFADLGRTAFMEFSKRRERTQ